MSSPLIECIPNFSEARRPEVVKAIVDAIKTVPGGHILDQHSDIDHNRTVLTLAGTPSFVEEATFRAIQKASELIDLNEHSGEHPRIGATDVVPFVPLRDASMQFCVEIARRLGKRVADELEIPVYLYEEAAARPERKDLENIRRGQFEILKNEIGVKPEREPDFGPKKLGPAGATVIGARQPLIAYNVYLNTTDVSIARKIGQAVRFSSGGLRFVKAMGMLVDGVAQVSMNLTNYQKTPLARVVEFIRREAARYGATVTHSELVGLIPQEALNDAATWYLQLDGFEPDQILEYRLDQAITKRPSAAQEKEPDFIDELASSSPTPGGGSAAAHTGSAAAALVSMVARLTVGKKKYHSVEKKMWDILEKSEVLRTELTEAVRLDAEAFDGFMKALKLPKNTPEEQDTRAKAIESATYHAAFVPLQVAKMAVNVLELAVSVAADGNINAISDAGSSAALSRAALTSASLNVNINLMDIQAQEKAKEMLEELSSLEQTAAQLEKEMQNVLSERGGFILS
ncbi:MAG: glutamate formimidoyltransferase [Anaerolineaceae bacterium]|nr:glutamate formimidoyltransferase [Anaerolineaceae bacterium]